MIQEYSVIVWSDTDYRDHAYLVRAYTAADAITQADLRYCNVRNAEGQKTAYVKAVGPVITEQER